MLSQSPSSSTDRRDASEASTPERAASPAFRRRLPWALWALVPVAALSFHYGPGQAAYVEDRAAALHAVTLEAEQSAYAAQHAAYAIHLEAIEARRAALLSQSPEDEARALEATQAEDRAYEAAAAEWKTVVARSERVLEALGESSPDQARVVRVGRARALVRSGEIWPGIAELEGVLAELESALGSDTDQASRAAGAARRELARLERTTREELATANYYGARLLRLSGMPPQEWMVESGKARQQFRYLAEHADRSIGGAGSADDTAAFAASAQRNLELVLNLEQSALVDLQGRPLPKESPCRGNQGNRPSQCKNPGKKQGDRPDGRGAGGLQDIGAGW